MKLLRKDALYKLCGTKKPRILYDVWEDTEGEFLVDVWRLYKYDTNCTLYHYYETQSLEGFEDTNKSKLEEMKVRYKVDDTTLKVFMPKKERNLQILSNLIRKYPRAAEQLLVYHLRKENE